MSVRYLTESDVDRLIRMPEVIGVMREAFRQLALGQAQNVPRQRARGTGIWLHSMSAAADYLQVVGWKQYTTTSEGARFHVGLYSQRTGELLALLQANRLGQARTGAVTGLAIDRLAAVSAERVGLIGTGWQAESQLEAAAVVRSLRQALVYSRDEARRHDFCRRLAARLSLDVVPVDRPQDAVRHLPVVITATNSRRPVLLGQWLAPGTLVCAIGSNHVDRAELDLSAVGRAGTIVCDCLECCRHEAGDLVQAVDAGMADWSEMVALADLVIDPDPMAGAADQIIVFKSVGMALEDVALAHHLLERADEQDVGSWLEMS